MTAEHEHDFNPVEALHYVEHLTPVGERVARKKDRQNRRRRKQEKHKDIEEQLQDKRQQEQDIDNTSDNEDHLDFHA